MEGKRRKRGVKLTRLMQKPAPRVAKGLESAGGAEEIERRPFYKEP